jgi:hypothetical protein
MQTRQAIEELKRRFERTGAATAIANEMPGRRVGGR